MTSTSEPGLPYTGPPPTTPPPAGLSVYPPSPYGWPGYPQPYGAAWWGPPAAPRRPGQVTAAAVLAFVQSALVTLVSLYLLVVAAAASALTQSQDLQWPVDGAGIVTEALTMALVQLVAVVVLAVAGVRVLIRRSWTTWWVFVAASGFQVLLAGYWAIRLSFVDTDIASMWVIWAMLFAAMPVVGLGLVVTGTGRQWFEGSPRRRTAG